jgi:hypothetical protein
MFLAPYAGLLLLGIPLAWLDRRFWFGLITSAALIVPMLVLPGRLFSVYWYVPAIGLAVTIGSMAQRARVPVVVTALALWMFVNYGQIRPGRNRLLNAANENRRYFDAVRELAKGPQLAAVRYDGWPPELEVWGAVGVVHLLCGGQVDVAPGNSLAGLPKPNALLHWDSATRSVQVVR